MFRQRQTYALRGHLAECVRRDGRELITLDALQGRWRLIRRIDDHRAGLTGRFNGEAVWCPDADGLRQEETGVLRYGTAAPMQASRAYLWRATSSGLAVLFEDGRPFHTLAQGRVADTHYCDRDIYSVSYDLTDWPIWRQSWRVTGPRKDMTLTSEFSRP